MRSKVDRLRSSSGVSLASQLVREDQPRPIRPSKLRSQGIGNAGLMPKISEVRTTDVLRCCLAGDTAVTRTTS
jgi:hypothetical protein